MPGAVGSIGNIFVDTQAIYSGLSYVTSICHVREDIYAIIYDRSGSANLTVKTVTIDDAGIISAVLDTQVIDSNGVWGRMVKLSSGYLAIVYQGSGIDGYVATISVDASGNISLVDSYEFEESNCYQPIIREVNGDKYAICYNAAGTIYIVTLTISEIGVITKSLIDSYNTAYIYGALDLDFIHLTGTIYAFIYAYNSVGCQIATIGIDTSGNIDAAPVDTQEVESTTARMPTMAVVDAASNVYTTVCLNADYKWEMSTWAISTAGVITNTPLDTWILDDAQTGHYWFSTLLRLKGGLFAWCFMEDGNIYVYTFLIDPDGTLHADAPLDTQQFVVGGHYPHLIRKGTDTGEVHILAYTNNSNYASVSTVTIVAGITYPTGTASQVRVTGLIHRYNRGIYNLEILLGDVIADFGMAELTPDQKTSYASKEQLEERKRREESEPIAPDVPKTKLYKGTFPDWGYALPGEKGYVPADERHQALYGQKELEPPKLTGAKKVRYGFLMNTLNALERSLDNPKYSAEAKRLWRRRAQEIRQELTEIWYA